MFATKSRKWQKLIFILVCQFMPVSGINKFMPAGINRGKNRLIPPGGINLPTLSLLQVECLLTLAIWSYGHEAEEYIFLNLPFPSNPKENSSICCILSTPEQNLLLRFIGCTPNTFHNTINKNVNHSNDTIDNLNQSSFHKPACQCQGHLRTESLSASAHILHCGVKYDLGWCGPASALKIVRQLIFDNHVTFV